MRQMVNLALRTEYSFKSKHTYGRIAELEQFENGTGYLGVGDVNGTYGHIQLEKFCKAKNFTPIFSTRLMVMRDEDRKQRTASGPEYIFIAKNENGFKELNELVRTAFDTFYYKPFVCLSDVFALSSDVIVCASNFVTTERIDFIALTPSTPRMLLDWDIPKVAMQDNFYPLATDKNKYELLCGARKHGDSFRFLFTNQTYPMHILSTAEWYRIWKLDEAIDNTHEIASMCSVEIPSASMVKFPDEADIKLMCLNGAVEKKIDLDDPVYKARFERELDIIIEKDYVDYFLVVADMIIEAKKHMLVGPSRGSCAGSLVCFLLDITSIDPIEHGLIFERFIDLNRHDLPDIDIDFPDSKRGDVIDYLIRKYRPENVCHISNINRLKAKSAIGNTGMALSIPFGEVETVKEAIVDRSGGDARAGMAARDTLQSTEVGKLFMEKYPAMDNAFALEGHATHTGKHAGGIIVCNEEITRYGGMNTRDGCVMMDKKDAEFKNLLKIDVLGLRTLSILEEAAELAGFDFRMYYEMPLDLDKVWTVFNEMRLSGIFQFEGQAMMMLCKEMGVHCFSDIVAITALARPGPLHSGGANKFVKRKNGVEEVEYISNHPGYIAETEETYGVIIYQEQLMNLCRNLGNMSWEEVSDIRRAASKTLGKEFFDQYRNSFLKGTRENKIPDQEAIEIWENMMTFGSWGMNKSHTVAYGYISYWCAFMKTHYPLQFAAATMNNTKSEDAALKMLRDMYENDGIEYIDVDPDVSEIDWSIHDGKLLGGLTNIVGLGEKGAKEIVKARKQGKPLKTSHYVKLISGETPYSILYPTYHWWGDYYENPHKYGLGDSPSKIGDVDGSGEYIIMGMAKAKDLRDMNEYNELVKRGGKVLTENDKFLRVVMEDDTGQILAKIDRFNFERLNGQYWTDSIVSDKTWLIMRGEVKDGWRVFNISAIANLEEIDYYGPNNLILERQQRKDKVLASRVGL